MSWKSFAADASSDSFAADDESYFDSVMTGDVGFADVHSFRDSGGDC